MTEALSHHKPQDHLSNLQVGERIIIDSNFSFTHKIQSNDLETLLSQCGFPENEREKTTETLFEKLQNGSTSFRISRNQEGGLDVIRQIQIARVYACDGEGKELRETFYQRKGREPLINRMRIPAKTTNISNLTEDELVDLAVSTLSEDMNLPGKDVENLFSTKSAVVEVKKDEIPKPSESVNGMKTTRLIADIKIQTPHIIDTVFEHDDGVYSFKWEFVKPEK